MIYLGAFCLSAGLAIFITLLVKKIAFRYNLLDQPRTDEGSRHIHKTPAALMGGVAIFMAFFLTVLVEIFWSDSLLGGFLLPKHLGVIFLGGLVLIIGGVLDDKYNLKPSRQIIFPIISALIVIAGGIGIAYINNPFGSTLYFDQLKLTLFSYQGVPYQIMVLADLFALIWILGSSYTTKFLDGLDGLVASITAVGSFVIFILALSTSVAQPETALLAITLVGALVGYLVFAWHPAKIFLGEGGSLFCGFMLAVLAILAGSKVATALLILGVPILDVIWVVLRRIWKKKSPFLADRQHLHFRLLDAGFSYQQAVLFLVAISAIFGFASLFLQSKEKLIALLILLGIMVILALVVVYLYQQKKRLDKER